MIPNIKGQIWKLGDDINTDVITPTRYLTLPLEEVKTHVLEAIMPQFIQEVKPGQIIIGGKNFGCGSSREQAPAAIKALGIAAVVAESFARIFFRNAIAIGLPVIICPKVTDCCDDMDELEIDFTQTKVTNTKSGKSLAFQPLPREMLEVLSQGGIEPMLKQVAATGRAESVS